jgi:hypothetical protein
MGNLQTSHPVELDEELRSDPRWQLLARILETEPFQKSHRLPALLSYLAEHSIRGNMEALTEQRIGTAVFGKPSGYSPAEDSAVRVHVRQLRLRLHEYFAREGRDEPLAVDVPKGSYELIFENAQSRPSLHLASGPVVLALAPAETKPRNKRAWLWPALLCAALLAVLVCGLGWYRTAQAAARARAVPWPLSEVVQNGRQTRIVVSDGSSMLRLLAKREFSLDQYLSPGFLGSMTPPHMDENLARLVTYISDSQVTSYADTLMAATFAQLAGPARSDFLVCTARDLNRREIDGGNLVFVGGPTSNPWVSLFADKLNFEVVEDGVGGKMYFRNRKPLPGEQPEYEGLRYTGSGGEDYATMSLVPAGSGQGNVLILQGLREEGTEALAILLANERTRNDLEQALKIREGSREPVYFEALIRTQTVAGAPVSFNLVATRIIPFQS